MNIYQKTKNKILYRKQYYKMRKNALLQLQETFILKSEDLEKLFEEEYKDVFKNQF